MQRGPWVSASYRELLRRAIRCATGRPVRSDSPAFVGDSLQEHAAIERIARRIDRAVDDKDWREMRSWFADCVAVDIGVVSGTEVKQMSADDFVTEVAALNATDKISYHSSTNSIVTIDGALATLKSHSYGWNRCDALDPAVYEVWGSMEYRLRRESVLACHHVRMAKWREAGNRASASGAACRAFELCATSNNTVIRLRHQ